MKATTIQKFIILGGSSSVLALNFGHLVAIMMRFENGCIFNTTAGSEDLEVVSSNTITLNAAAEIILDTDGGNVVFKDGEHLT